MYAVEQRLLTYKYLDIYSMYIHFVVPTSSTISYFMCKKLYITITKYSRVPTVQLQPTAFQAKGAPQGAIYLYQTLVFRKPPKPLHNSRSLLVFLAKIHSGTTFRDRLKVSKTFCRKTLTTKAYTKCVCILQEPRARGSNCLTQRSLLNGMGRAPCMQSWRENSNIFPLQANWLSVFFPNQKREINWGIT